MSLKLSIEVANKIAISKGGLCLSTEYKNKRCKLQWMCGAGHVWNSSLECVRNKNTWCKKCFVFKRRLGIETANKIARKRKGECLSQEYTNSHTNLLWKCKKGHIWSASLGNVKNQKQWCPECSGNKRLSIQDAKIIAKSNGGKCLSQEYTNSRTNLLWKCKKGHIFESSMDKVKNQKQWCSECNIRKSQTKLANIIEELFGQQIIQNCKRFPWLKMRNNRRLEIDIYIPNIMLAIEYDGEQHFKPVCFGGISLEDANVEFKKAKNRDKVKNRLINKHIKLNGSDIKHFIRFDYKEKLTNRYVGAKLKELNIL